jgi:hypothetical protein
MDIDHRKFTLESYEFSVLDDRIMAFCNLKGITWFEIKNCLNLVSLSSEAFSQLTALKHLLIHGCPNLTKLNSMTASSFVPPSLKTLDISKCGITGRWLTQMLSHSLSLEELLLSDCPQIKFLSIIQPAETEGTGSLVSAVMASARDEQHLKLPYDLLCSLKKLWIQRNLDLEFCGCNGDFVGLTSLMELHLHDCPKLVSSLVGELKDDGTVDVRLLPPSLKDLSISPLPENMQSFAPEGLLHLKRLNLYNSPCLKYLHMHSCTALQELRFWGCAQLAELEGLQFLSSLRSMYIEMSPELTCAWSLKLQEQEEGANQIQLLPPSLEEFKIWNLTDSLQSRLLSCLPTITKLGIWSSPELTSLQLGCRTALKELEIGKCDSLALEGLQFCRNLTSLKVFDSTSLSSCEIWPGLRTLEASKASVLSRPFCKQLTSLRRLEFGSNYRASLVSLTREQESALQLLTSLQELHFYRCPNLLSLPTNLHSLTSLESLYISHCQNITRLPDMGLPPSLRGLHLSNCSEELGMQCRTAATEKLRVWIDNYSLRFKI